ncbi:MAG: D-Ala-D-Ala carboxypeptidase family metallohydrolase [Synechococcus sp.]
MLGASFAIALSGLISGVQYQQGEGLGFVWSIDRRLLVLAVFGWFGGVIHSMADGSVDLPTARVEGAEVRPGIIGDVLVGVSGAFIAYAFMPMEWKGTISNSLTTSELQLLAQQISAISPLSFSDVQNALVGFRISDLDVQSVRTALTSLAASTNVPAEAISNLNLEPILTAFTGVLSPNREGAYLNAAVIGLVGGYGGKVIIKEALGQLLKKVQQGELENLTAENQQLKQQTSVMQAVNSQLENGLTSEKLDHLRTEILAASREVRGQILGALPAIGGLSVRGRIVRGRLSRSIPILQALVAAEPKNDRYLGQLGFAYLEASSPNLSQAIVTLTNAIAARGESIEGSRWKYELFRAIARIQLGSSDSRSLSDEQNRQAIYEDLMVVERQYGLSRLFDDAADEEVDMPLTAWLQMEKPWLQTQPDGKLLLAVLDRTAATPSPDSSAIGSTPQETAPQAIATAKPQSASTPFPSTAAPATPAPSDKLTSNPWDEALKEAPTTGASALTARQDGLQGGLEASRQMAKTDLPAVLQYKDQFERTGAKFDIPPALLAAIASRESRGGKALRQGFGDGGNAFGIMQVDKRFHKLAGVSEGPGSLAHIDQATGILKDYLNQVITKFSHWEKKFQLEGAVVAYNSGVRNVQSQSRLNIGTTGGDYGSDVIARAWFYTNSFKSLAECRAGTIHQQAKAAPADLDTIATALQEVDDTVSVDDLTEAMVKALENALTALGFMQPGGDRSQLPSAWGAFKQSVNQGSPELLGPGSIRLLLDALGLPHPVADEQQGDASATVNQRAGLRTGKSKQLPGGQLVFENENIVPGIQLTWGECTKGMADERWPTKVEEVVNAKRLAKAFGEVRTRYGKPLRINSGFRPPAVNARVGGASRSQHLYFKALDIAPVGANFPGDLLLVLDAVRRSPSVTGIGLGQKRGFIHMDIRDGGRIEFPY